MFGIDKIVINIVNNEGFISTPYIDPIVKKDMQANAPEALEIIEKFLPSLNLTIGNGTLLKISKKQAAMFTRSSVYEIIAELKRRKPLFVQLPFEVQEVLVEMAYQMGVSGLLKFKKTWEFLEKHEFEKASYEMLDSAWYRELHELDMLDGTDSVNRAEKLSQRMRRVGVEEGV